MSLNFDELRTAQSRGEGLAEHQGRPLCARYRLRAFLGHGKNCYANLATGRAVLHGDFRLFILVFLGNVSQPGTSAPFI